MEEWDDLDTITGANKTASKFLKVITLNANLVYNNQFKFNFLKKQSA